MRKYISFPGTLWLLLSAFAIELCLSTTEITCSNKTGDPLPKFPDAFSTNIRINFWKQPEGSSIELRAVTNLKENKVALEFWANKRHVKYIQIGNQQAFIKYDDDSSPTCSIKTVPTVIELEEEDLGPNRILEKIAEVIHEENKDQAKFANSGATFDNGAAVRKWEGCFTYPKIKIALSFTAKDWEQAHTSALHKGFEYLSTMDAQSDDAYLTALFSHFNPVMPDESEFQPPENVYCKGFTTKKTMPEMMDYFSYDSEIIVYESSIGIAPISSHRRVYYDFPGRISRIDFNDPLAEDPDLFSKVTAQGISIIHDYNSGVQYNMDPITGKCHVDSFQVKVGPDNVKPSTDNKMQSGKEFFSFNAENIVYNGQFPTRGYTADVFTANVKSSNGKKSFIYTWYFSSDRTQVVENDNVEKDVLLRMVIRPEAADGKEGEVDVNFYNFAREEPSAFMFDISSCYDDLLSKTFVLTFPVKEELKGYEKIIKSSIHLFLKDVIKVSKQRISVTEVVFDSKYMYAEFKLLAPPDSLVKLKTPTKESTLDEAVNKLKESISYGNFTISIPINKNVIVLKLEPNGLNEFAGDRRPATARANYNEGSVIGLTIGMLILGFVLGFVTLNLIVSKKFGVSLFQKSRTIRDPFSSSLGDSTL